MNESNTQTLQQKPTPVTKPQPPELEASLSIFCMKKTIYGVLENFLIRAWVWISHIRCMFSNAAYLPVNGSWLCRCCIPNHLEPTFRSWNDVQLLQEAGHLKLIQPDRDLKGPHEVVLDSIRHYTDPNRAHVERLTSNHKNGCVRTTLLQLRTI